VTAPSDFRTATQTQLCSITAVDLSNPARPMAQGYIRQESYIPIDLRYHTGAVHVIPAIGEQWYVKRLGLCWVLDRKLPFNTDVLLNVADNPVPGQVQIGSSGPQAGPLQLSGSSVNVGGPLSFTPVPDDQMPDPTTVKPGTMIYNVSQGLVVSDGSGWAPAGSGGGPDVDNWDDIVLPPDGVPRSDLDTSTRDSLDKADTALQTVPTDSVGTTQIQDGSITISDLDPATISALSGGIKSWDSSHWNSGSVTVYNGKLYQAQADIPAGSAPPDVNSNWVQVAGNSLPPDGNPADYLGGDVLWHPLDISSVAGLSAALAALSAGGGLPLTTKGDILTRTATDLVRKAVGTNGYALLADATQTDGLRWGQIAANSLLGMLDPSQVPNLSDLLGGVTAGQCPLLSDLLGALNPSQLSGVLTPGQVPTLNNLLGSLVPGQILGTLSPSQVPILSALGGLLNPSQLSGVLGASQVPALSALTGLLNPTQIFGALLPAQVPNIQDLLGALTAGQIPNLPASIINAGTFDPTRIPLLSNLLGSVTAGQVPALSALSGLLNPSQLNGALGASQVPALSALTGLLNPSQIFGTLLPAQVPGLSSLTGLLNPGQITGTLAAGQVPTLQNLLGTLTAGQLGPLPAAQITSGQFPQSMITNLITDLGGKALGTDLTSLMSTLGLGTATNTAITNRFANINASGLLALVGLAPGALPSGITLPGGQLTGSVAAALISGVLGGANIPSLPPGQIVGPGTFAQGLIPSLTGGWGGTIAGSLLTGSVASTLLSGVLNQTLIPSLTSGWGGTIAGSLLSGNVAASLINGALTGATIAGSALTSAITAANVPSLPAGWGKTIDGSLLGGSVLGSLISGALSGATLAASALTAGAIPAGITLPGSQLSSAISAANVPALPAGWGKTIDGSLLGGSVAGSLISGLLNASTLPSLPAGWGKTIDASLIINALLPANIPTIDASKVVGGIFNINQIPQTQLALDASQIVSGELARWLMPLVPVSSIGNVSPELLANPNYATAASVSGAGTWTWLATPDHTGDGSGCVSATCNGTLKQLMSDPDISVADGQVLNCSHWLQWSGVTGSGACFKLQVIAYQGTALYNTTDLQTISNPAASSGWQQLSGTYSVPAGAGVTSIRLAICITAAATAGTTYWDDGSVKKSQLMLPDWVNGLVGFQNNTNTQVAARALQTDVMSLVNNLGLGSFASVSAGLTPITNRMQNLNASGQLPGSALIGSVASTLISGVLGIGNIPTSQLTKGNISDLQLITDQLTNGLIGAGSQYNSTAIPVAGSASARGSIDRIFQQVSDNVSMVQAMQVANQQTQQTAGVSITVDFSTVPDGPAPSQWTVTYSGSGTSVAGVKGGIAGWTTLNNDGNRTAIWRYNVQPTATDWQQISGSMQAPPAQASGSSAAPRLYAMGRVNSTSTDYVWARGYCTGFLSYAADLGYTKAGVDTVWVSGINFGWNLSISMRCGANNNAREYQVFAGTTLVKDYVEVGTNSMMDSSHRYWGCRSEMTSGSGGALDPGGIASGTCFDNMPPSSLGSTFRASRANTATVSVAGTGQQFLPGSFFDTVERITGDYSWDAVTAGGVLTFQTEGTFLVNIGYGLNNLPGNSKLDIAIIVQYASGGGATLIRRCGSTFADSYAANSAYNATGCALIYFKPGDRMAVGTIATSGSTSLVGSTDQARSFLEVALVNRSLG
jgi:hypothetical protein